jgi:hypothetical protein
MSESVARMATPSILPERTRLARAAARAAPAGKLPTHMKRPTGAPRRAVVFSCATRPQNIMRRPTSIVSSKKLRTVFHAMSTPILVSPVLTWAPTPNANPL